MAAYLLDGGRHGLGELLGAESDTRVEVLVDGTEVEVVELCRGSALAEAARDLLNRELEGGLSYPQQGPLTTEAFEGYYLSHDAFCVRRKSDKSFCGSVYIKPNFPGRSSHICNGGFIVHESMRNKGVGKLLLRQFLRLAPKLGYEACFFNLVFTDNAPSIKLWKEAGFVQTGLLPKAAKKADGSYQDAYQFYIEFSNCQPS